MNTTQEKTLRAILKDKIAIANATLTVDDTIKALPSIPTGAVYALITVESNATGIAVRYWEYGTPSSTEGHGRSNGDAFDISTAENIKNTRITRAQAGTHKIMIQYYK